MLTPTPLPQANPMDIGLCPDRLQRLLNVLRERIERQHIPGAVVLVARQGHIGLFEALGQQDPATGTPMRADSIFRIYSMTKPLVSVATMMLIERGQLLLSDPVSRWLPEFANPQVWTPEGLVPARQNATVQDLLRHTAGLIYEFTGNNPVQELYAQAHITSRHRTSAEFVQALAALPLRFHPGSMWAYSHATDVLGCVLEAVSGLRLGELLQREIFGPLGMVDTGFVVPPEQHHRIAEPFAHDPDGGVPMPVLDPRQAPVMDGGGGGLLSTAMDYARFVQCLRNRGELDGVRLLGPQTLAFMSADHVGNIPSDGALMPAGHGFGLGFAVRRTAGEANMPGSVGTYHWSGIAGTSFFIDPALDLQAILLTQAPNQRDHYRQLFRHLVYAAVR